MCQINIHVHIASGTHIDSARLIMASILITLWSISQEIVHVWRVKKKIKSNYTAPLAPSCASNILEADIVLRGYSGWNSRRAVQVLDQVFPKDAAIQPSLVIVYFGGNDSVHPHATGLGPHVPLPEYIENTRKIAMHLKSISDKTRVIFLSAPPASEEQIGIHLRGKMDMVRTNESCRIYSEACLEVCREMNLKAVDLWTAIQQVDNWETVCLKDGIHFAPEGSRIIVKEILRVIKEAHWEPSLYWKAMPTEFSEDSPYDPVGVEGKTVNVSEPDLFGEFPWE